MNIIKYYAFLNRFHVAARNYPIPEPPPTRYHTRGLHPLFRNGRYVRLLPHIHRPPPPPDKAEKDELKAVRQFLTDTFLLVQDSVRALFGVNCDTVKELDMISSEITDEFRFREGWKQRHAKLKKKEAGVKKAIRNVIEQKNQALKLRHEIREDNRGLRQQLTSLEINLVNCKDERRKLKLRTGDGPRVAEMRRLKFKDIKLSNEILKYARARKQRLESAQIISDKLSNHISDLRQLRFPLVPKKIQRPRIIFEPQPFTEEDTNEIEKLIMDEENNNLPIEYVLPPKVWRLRPQTFVVEPEP